MPRAGIETILAAVPGRHMPQARPSPALRAGNTPAGTGRAPVAGLPCRCRRMLAALPPCRAPDPRQPPWRPAAAHPSAAFQARWRRPLPRPPPCRSPELSDLPKPQRALPARPAAQRPKLSPAGFRRLVALATAACPLPPAAICAATGLARRRWPPARRPPPCQLPPADRHPAKMTIARHPPLRAAKGAAIDPAAGGRQMALLLQAGPLRLSPQTLHRPAQPHRVLPPPEQ